MTELIRDDPCVVFALRRESLAFRRHFPPHEPFRGAPCWARFCGPPRHSVLLVETGPGSRRAGTAMEWLLGRPALDNLPYRPRVVVSAGFSGALQEAHGIGDIILATDVVDTAGNHWPTTWPGPRPASAGGPRLIPARVLAVDRLIGSPAEKRSLGVQYRAAAVDMESAVIARCCTEHAIPFGCVRTISDRLDMPLSPKLIACLKGGRVSLLRLLLALAGSPALGLELWRLARHTRLAAETLGQVLTDLLAFTFATEARP